MLPYDQKLNKLARNLRNNSTLSEVLLWNQLKSDKILGYRFNRQKPIGRYIVDFYCDKLKLVIEIDGSSHDNKIDQDIKRKKYLESFDLTVLRILDKNVKNELDAVIRKIMHTIYEIEQKKSNPPNSL